LPPTFEVLDFGGGGTSSLNQNQSWDKKPDLFDLKIAWDLARAFEM
jgi:hypothetical protein